MTKFLPIDEIAPACVDILRQRPSALFSDFDGTLSPIASTPSEAIPYGGAPEAFERVMARVDVGGFITGRAVDDVLGKMNVEGAMAVGNHGLEWLIHGQREDRPEGTAAIAGLASAFAEIQAIVEDRGWSDGMIFEDKRLSGSIHFRNADDPIALEHELGPVVREIAARHHLRVVGGKMVFELRPLANLSKGTALRELLERESLNGAIFLGDDLSDIDGFRALQEARDAGHCATLSVGVVSEDAFPEVLAAADVAVRHPSDTVALLNAIADLLDEKEAS